MTIAERLYKFRKDKGLSQEDLANELGVTRQTISKWETGESTPDFDKIIPLCNFYGITSDELLTGSKNIVEAKACDVKSNFARNVAIAVMLYIVSLVALIICAVQFNQPIIGISLFFILIAMATGLLIYNGIYYNKESKEEKSTERNTLVKQINGIIDAIGLIVYFLISFTTGAWHITWIIFIVAGLCQSIVKLLFDLKKENSITKEDE